MPWYVMVGEVEAKRFLDKKEAINFAQILAKQKSDELNVDPSNGVLGPGLVYNCELGYGLTVRVEQRR